MTARGEVEPLTPGVELGEGPVWDDRQGVLIWVNIWAGDVHSYDPASGRDSAIGVGQPVGAAVPRRSGGLVLAVRDGFAFLDPDGRLTSVAEVEAGNPGNRMNDGKCDRHGRFWAGTMAGDSRPGAGALYRLDPDLSVTRVLEGVTVSNGLAWSLDDRTMYYIDTPTQRVDAFDYDPGSGTIENRRPLIEIPEEAGSPDGMTIDAEGFLWVALYGGRAVRRFSPDGRLERVVELPAANVTSCAFGDPDLDRLFITSARQELSPADLAAQPHAGALFGHRPGAQGLPADRFAG